ncbi:hypothetical protein BRD16_01695 [Halobacteriales archaeon SW_6_65_46]|nr:MAG: hypothetical protein BRD16_01695 [Halobacteriales archaeon SW_6_65_46]
MTNKIDRRTFIKGAGVTTGLAATGATSSALDAGPVGRSQAIAPIAIGGYVAAGMVAGAVANHYLGKDVGQLDGSEETADLHADLYARLKELKAANGDVLTATSNRLEDSRNVVWPSVKLEAVKAFNSGDSESAVKSAATAPVDDHYSTIRRNIINRGTEFVNSLISIRDLHQTDSGLTSSPVLRVKLISEDTTNDTVDTAVVPPSGWNTSQRTTTLFDGSTVTGAALTVNASDIYANTGIIGGDVMDVTQDGGSGPYDSGASNRSDAGTTISMNIDSIGGNPKLTCINPSMWNSLHTEVQNAHSQMVANAEQFVISLMNNYSPGDLDHTQWMDASTLASELSTSYESTGYNAYAAAEAAMLGIPGSTEQTMVVQLQETGLEFNGSIWSNWTPAADSTSTATSTASSTPSIAGESAFALGETYDPSLTPKPVYLSYEYAGPEYIKGSDVFKSDGEGGWTKTSISSQSAYTEAYSNGDPKQVGFTKVKQPFTVVEAFDAETGDQVDVVRTESKNHQTSSVDVTSEQMQQLLKLQEEIRQNQQSGGGADFSLPNGLSSLPFGGLGAGIVGAGAIGLAALSQLSPRR